MSLTLERLGSVASDTSPSLMRVGQWISANPIQTLSQSAEEIALLTGTSVAAINRFSRAAGYKGFADLKAQLGVELQSALESAEKPGNPQAASELPALSRAIVEASTAPQIPLVAGEIMKARRVWLVGFGSSTYLAGYALHALTPFVDFVTSISGEGGTEEATLRLARCGKGDLMIAFSLPLYSKDTVHLARFARTRGVRVVAVTDSANSPLAEVAQSLLLVPAAHPVLPSSSLGMLAVIEALVTKVVKLNPDAARLARELTDSVLPHLTF
ncbi:MurR/RpiR family transcriptional regulator [Mesorhizobium sp. KR1-2]|uniref:MurR/RpiR family transcriptional regulator n=1 Tax=Mesorhizobium sp. KR1-2 TaxID=3156609 RepID=UPI0032B5D882